MKNVTKLRLCACCLSLSLLSQGPQRIGMQTLRMPFGQLKIHPSDDKGNSVVKDIEDGKSVESVFENHYQITSNDLPIIGDTITNMTQNQQPVNISGDPAHPLEVPCVGVDKLADNKVSIMLKSLLRKIKDNNNNELIVYTDKAINFLSSLKDALEPTKDEKPKLKIWGIDSNNILLCAVPWSFFFAKDDQGNVPLNLELHVTRYKVASAVFTIWSFVCVVGWAVAYANLNPHWKWVGYNAISVFGLLVSNGAMYYKMRS